MSKDHMLLRPFLFILFAAFLVFPTLTLASSIVISNVPTIGTLPWIVTALTNPAGTDVYPLGPGYQPLAALFDTGSTKVAIAPADAGTLGITNATQANVRIDGLGAGTSGGYPLGPQGSLYPAQAEVGNIKVNVPVGLDVTLIGAPVVNNVEALIDYTNLITTLFATGPDITFSNGDIPFTADLTLQLTRLAPPITTYPYDVGGRYLIQDVSFADSGQSVSSGYFLYDTGTNVTIVTPSNAMLLGLTTPEFTVMIGSDSLNGFYLDSITMTGLGGDTYTLLNAPILVAPSNAYLGGVGAIIGSNLFSQTELLFDGKDDTLGIRAAVPEPSTWILLSSGLAAFACLQRRRKKIHFCAWS